MLQFCWSTYATFKGITTLYERNIISI